jgi:ribosomal subunit interface protein
MRADITARNFEADDKVREYLDKKIGNLDRFLPRNAREIARAEVVLSHDPNATESSQYTCEVIIGVPGDRIMSKESTINIYAAIDIVEAKLRAQLTKYKAKHTTERRRGRMMWRLVGRKSETDTQQPDYQPEN